MTDKEFFDRQSQIHDKYKGELNDLLQQYFKERGNVHKKGTVLKLHPELAESEDERIRKELIGHLKEWIAYLEKQKEQKSVAHENNFVSKPVEWSEEQMKALKDVICWDSKMYYMKGLRALYNDLKKL